MAGLGWLVRLRKDSGFRDFGGDELGDILFGDRDGVGGDGFVDNRDDAPALEAAERAGFHHLHLVADLGLVLLVVDVEDGLAVDDLVVKGVRRLVGDRDLDGLVARAARNETDLGLARAPRAGNDGSGPGE